MGWRLGPRLGQDCLSRRTPTRGVRGMAAKITRRAILSAIGATAVGGGLVPALSTPAEANPQTGTPAPAFTATDSKGQQHSLAAYRGKIVILEWTNHECPYTVKHYVTGNMQPLQKAATDAGAIWFTVVSSRPGTQGHVHGLEADKLTEDRRASPTAVLLDPQGELGRLYSARTTPHM